MAYQNIEEERARLGLTRTALAAEMSISLPTYNKYVSGEAALPSDKLLYLHRRFGVSTDYLLGLTINPITEPPAPEQ